MSLINDALRRAHQLAAAGAVRSNDQMPDYRLGRRAQAMRVSWATAAVLVVVMSGLGAVLLSWWFSSGATTTVSSMPAAAATPTLSEEELVARLLARLQQQQQGQATSVPHVAEAAQEGITAAAPEPRQAPKLILQGVTLDGSSREAMINGVGVRVGEEIAGCRIIAIDSRQVRLWWEGRELTLRMP